MQIVSFFVFSICTTIAPHVQKQRRPYLICSKYRRLIIKPQRVLYFADNALHISLILYKCNPKELPKSNNIDVYINSGTIYVGRVYVNKIY